MNNITKAAFEEYEKVSAEYSRLVAKTKVVEKEWNDVGERMKELHSDAGEVLARLKAKRETLDDCIAREAEEK